MSMASKLGFILTLFFLIQMVAYCGDLSALQALHSLLDAVSITAGKAIAIEGSITSVVSAMVMKDCGGRIYALSSSAPQVGAVYEFAIEKAYQSLILSPKSMMVTVKRSTVIGYRD
jgi:hypothetical protein